MRKTAFLTLALVLALAGACAHAQGTPPGATQGLPFVNEGANQPVLHPLSSDMAPIEAADPEAMGAHGESAKKGLPQFDLSTFARQLFWLALTFAFAYLVFARKTLPSISAAMTKRNLRIEDDLAQAEKLNKQVEDVRKAYEAAIAKAQSEASSIINNLQGDIKKTTEAQDAAFKSRAEQAVSQLEMNITANRGRVLGELNTLAASLAVDITNRIAGVKVDEATARATIDNAQGTAKAA
jgi:F-type H+-transporting ATPase subunit b